MLNKKQFKELIEDTLKQIDLYSENAVYLLLGTSAQESKFGTYLKQLGRGPALGFFQMEPATEKDIWDKFISKNDDLSYMMGELFQQFESNPARLKYDIKYMIVMARLHYLRVPEPLPDSSYINGLAGYWKKYYNTELGAGTVEEFIRNYSRYVL